MLLNSLAVFRTREVSLNPLPKLQGLGQINNFSKPQLLHLRRETVVPVALQGCQRDPQAIYKWPG